MQYSFLRVFANDGLLDRAELDMIERLALRDGRVDDKEREVLSGIFARVRRETADPAVWEEIQRLKSKFAVP